jgi:hypothetical protein
MPQDGHDTQDGERAAGKRWMVQHARHLASHGVPFLGDALSSNHPLGQLVLPHGLNVIFVAKPDSQAPLYERVAFWQANDGIKVQESCHWNGRFTDVTMRRSHNDVLLRGGRGALSANWFAMTVVKSNTGEPHYHNSCLTHHHLTADSVTQVARAGRGRWTIANANHNVLNPKGYHIAHNFGHGKRDLSACMRSLNLLALLFPTVLGWCDDHYALLRQTLVRRQTFFDDMRALTRYMVFESWHQLMEFMITGLELQPKFDTG